MLTPDFLTGRFLGEQKLGSLKDTKTKYFSLQNLSTINEMKQKRSQRKLKSNISGSTDPWLSYLVVKLLRLLLEVFSESMYKKVTIKITMESNYGD